MEPVQQPELDLTPYALWPVAPGQIAHLWELVAPDIERIVQRPGMRATALHFRQQCLEQKAQLFLVLEPTGTEGEPPKYVGCVITRLLFALTGHRTLEVAGAAGDGADPASVAGLLQGLESFARAEGCCAMEFVGRAGWAKLLPEGYREVGRIFEKEL